MSTPSWWSPSNLLINSSATFVKIRGRSTAALAALPYDSRGRRGVLGGDAEGDEPAIGQGDRQGDDGEEVRDILGVIVTF